VGGILLWRRAPFGYVVAVGLLLQAGVYLIGLSLITVLQEIVTGQPFDPIAVVPGIVIGGICLGLIRPFLGGTSGQRQATALNTQLAEPARAKT
jgi:hypothetical protein